MDKSEEAKQKLIQAAMEARSRAYAPYSRFAVGAALLTKGGKTFTGCNVESASYSPTTCAERVAVLKAVSEGERGFSMIAVIGGPAHMAGCVEEFAAPCGVCRQLIYEFGGDTLILMAKSASEYFARTVSELLPFGFGPGNLR